MTASTQPRSDFFRRLLIVGLVAALIGLLVPVLEPFALMTESRGSESAAAVLLRRLPNVLTAAWFAFLGGCLGSFLNVVVYRAPRGMSLMGTSKCPYCKNSIAPLNNLPVLAWLKLEGQCRDCGEPIAARYPMVEFSVAALVMTLAVTEIALGGVNLSIKADSVIPGFTTNLFDPGQSASWPVILSFAWHSGIVIMLLGMALMLSDGSRVPGWLFALGAVAVLFMAMVQPETLYTLRKMPAEVGLRVARDICIASALGWGIGFCLSFDERKRGLRPYRAFPWMFALAGAALGWPVVVFCGIFSPVLEFLFRLAGKQTPSQAIIFAATLVFFVITGYPLLYPYLAAMPG